MNCSHEHKEASLFFKSLRGHLVLRHSIPTPGYSWPVVLRHYDFTFPYMVLNTVSWELHRPEHYAQLPSDAVLVCCSLAFLGPFTRLMCLPESHFRPYNGDMPYIRVEMVRGRLSGALKPPFNRSLRTQHTNRANCLKTRGQWSSEQLPGPVTPLRPIQHRTHTDLTNLTHTTVKNHVRHEIRR